MYFLLDDNWTLYLQYKDKGKNYNENLEKIIDFNDVCTFWRIYNNIPKIDTIFSDGNNVKKMKRNNCTPCSYSYFRKNIKPLWEDKDNINGFEYSFRININNRTVDKDWLDIILKLIGDPTLEFINGIRFVDSSKYKKVMYRIEFWIRENENKKEIEQIIRTNFNISYNMYIKTHQDIKET